VGAIRRADLTFLLHDERHDPPARSQPRQTLVGVVALSDIALSVDVETSGSALRNVSE